MRGIFKIRFLTSELSALEAKIIDHEKLLKMTLELSKDTSVKRERRAEIKELHRRLKDSERFFNSLGVMEALEMISPNQKWGQRQDISALEREWAKKLCTDKIEALRDGEVNENTEKQLKKIDLRRSGT